MMTMLPPLLNLSLYVTNMICCTTLCWAYYCLLSLSACMWYLWLLQTLHWPCCYLLLPSASMWTLWSAAQSCTWPSHHILSSLASMWALWLPAQPHADHVATYSPSQQVCGPCNSVQLHADPIVASKWSNLQQVCVTIHCMISCWPCATSPHSQDVCDICNLLHNLILTMLSLALTCSK
jgi:hypothetical protein